MISAHVVATLDAASSMNIPLEKNNVQIKRSKVEVVISATYEKPVDLKLGTYTYRFSSEQSAPLF